MITEMERISVIIPTYNRGEMLRKTVDSLNRQETMIGGMELIVVDDGSDQVIEVSDELPFDARVIRQINLGATEARNRGARESKGAVLIFVDDDVELDEGALENLVLTVDNSPRCLVMGRLIPKLEKQASLYGSLVAYDENNKQAAKDVSFTECMTGLLAMRRDDFFEAGMFVDPTGGWPNWDDVEFGNRCVKKGYHLVRCCEAVGYHRDHALSSLKTSCERIERAAYSAVRLEMDYPEIFEQLLMFEDKQRIKLGEDSFRIVVRKVLRKISATRGAVWGMEEVVRVLEGGLLRSARNDGEGLKPSLRVLRVLYRWVIGAYIYRGYREGLREFEVRNAKLGMAGGAE